MLFWKKRLSRCPRGILYRLQTRGNAFSLFPEELKTLYASIFFPFLKHTFCFRLHRPSLEYTVLYGRV